jgi:hypothetical protein
MSTPFMTHQEVRSYKSHSSEKLQQLRADCLELEREAGIVNAMDQARAGRFMPLGAVGAGISPEEFFADKHEHFRECVRDAYFSVANVVLRKRLINAQRDIEAQLLRCFEADVLDATKAVNALKALGEKKPWTLASLIAVKPLMVLRDATMIRATLVIASPIASSMIMLFDILVGYVWFGLPGAMGGAVAGWYFLDLYIAENPRGAVAAEINRAVEALEYAKKSLAEQMLRPTLFAESEAMNMIRL